MDQITTVGVDLAKDVIVVCAGNGGMVCFCAAGRRADRAERGDVGSGRKPGLCAG